MKLGKLLYVLRPRLPVKKSFKIRVFQRTILTIFCLDLLILTVECNKILTLKSSYKPKKRLDLKKKRRKFFYEYWWTFFQGFDASDG